MITHRGNWSVFSDEGLIHLKVPAKRDGTRDEHPLCGNGNFHLRWTDKEKQVTCPACDYKLLLKAQARRERDAKWAKRS